MPSSSPLVIFRCRRCLRRRIGSITANMTTRIPAIMSKATPNPNALESAFINIAPPTGTAKAPSMAKPLGRPDPPPLGSGTNPGGV